MRRFGSIAKFIYLFLLIYLFIYLFLFLGLFSVIKRKSSRRRWRAVYISLKRTIHGFAFLRFFDYLKKKRMESSSECFNFISIDLGQSNQLLRTNLQQCLLKLVEYHIRPFNFPWKTPQRSLVWQSSKSYKTWKINFVIKISWTSNKCSR